MGVWLWRYKLLPTSLKGSRSWAWGGVGVQDLELWDRTGGAGVGLAWEPVLMSHSLSSSQNGDETGTWPNNQFDTEMLQAMILASASGKCWDGRPGVLGTSHCHHTLRLAVSLHDFSGSFRWTHNCRT